MFSNSWQILVKIVQLALWNCFSPLSSAFINLSFLLNKISVTYCHSDWIIDRYSVTALTADWCFNRKADEMVEAYWWWWWWDDDETGCYCLGRPRPRMWRLWRLLTLSLDPAEQRRATALMMMSGRRSGVQKIGQVCFSLHRRWQTRCVGELITQPRKVVWQ